MRGKRAKHLRRIANATIAKHEARGEEVSDEVKRRTVQNQKKWYKNGISLGNIKWREDGNIDIRTDDGWLRNVAFE